MKLNRRGLITGVAALASYHALADGLSGSMSPQLGGGINNGFDGGIGGNGNSVGPLRFVTSDGLLPVATSSAVVASATTTRTLTRCPFTVGSGDLSQIVMSFVAWFLSNSGSGVTPVNGYTIESIAVEYNGTFSPVTFGGSRSKIVNAGDTDIQSDPLLPSAFSLTKFAQGSTGFVRMMLTFANPATDKVLTNANTITGQVERIYDVTKVLVTNGVDSTGAIAYSMINGGVNGVDALAYGGIMPIMLGRYVAGDAPTWVAIGDSKTRGTGDTFPSTNGINGLTRAFFTNSSLLPAGSISNLNMGCPSGIAADWAGGTPTLMTTYLKYAKYAIENYGTNSTNAAASQAIHATLRVNGIKKILRTSLTPKGTSTDSWATEVNQTTSSGWSPGGTADIFEQAMQALVAADLTYIDTLSVRGSTHWLWIVTGAAFYSTGDGLHQSPVGYELTVGSPSSVVAQSGTTSNTLRAVIAALP